MIGQERLKDIFSLQIENHNFPRFCILTGCNGIGKKTLAEWIVNKFRESNPQILSYKLPDVKIDTIREMINTSYQATNPIIYIIADADSMSVAAKNSLLKVTEEPPNNAYFIMTLESVEMTLETVKSRASIYLLDSYKKAEIEQFMKRGYNLTDKEQQIVGEICDVPGDVIRVCESKPVEFYEYVTKVVDNIHEVEGANAFKIADKLALKPDAEGYDVKLFLRAFMTICMNRIQTDPLRYTMAIAITCKYINQLGIRGVSKQMLIDAWMLEIRKNWLR
jgi:hypothetical protein